MSPHSQVADGGAESQDDEDRDEGSEIEEGRADQRRARAKDSYGDYGAQFGIQRASAS